MQNNCYPEVGSDTFNLNRSHAVFVLSVTLALQMCIKNSGFGNVQCEMSVYEYPELIGNPCMLNKTDLRLHFPGGLDEDLSRYVKYEKPY